MKRLIAVVFIFTAISTQAQSKLSVFKSKATIRPEIEKVVGDYFNHFKNIIGDTILQTVSTIEFSSKIIPEGALETSITQYKTPKTYSWQSTLFKSEEFKEAVAKYRQYYRQLSGTTFTFSDKRDYRIAGNYDAPDEGRTFASSILEAQSYDPAMKNFKIEIGLNYFFPEWTVSIMVYEKIDDENIRPSSGYLYR